MPSSYDIRGIAVKLLKAHKMRHLSLTIQADPATGLRVHVLKFRRDKDQSPKAFFDSLNDHGIQYKKLSKDPDSLEIVCELWPKGQKRRAVDAREDARQKARTQQNQGPSGTPTKSLNYMGIPSPSHPVVVSSTCKTAGEQDWDEVRRKVSSLLKHLDLSKRPEIRQLTESLAGEIVKTLGQDSILLKDTKLSDLKSKVEDFLVENIEYLVNPEAVAESMMRRISLTPTQYIAKLKIARRSLATLQSKVPNELKPQVAVFIGMADSALENVLNGDPETFDWDSPVVRLASSRDFAGALHYLVESF